MLKFDPYEAQPYSLPRAECNAAKGKSRQQMTPSKYNDTPAETGLQVHGEMITTILAYSFTQTFQMLERGSYKGELTTVLN